ncbi:MAG: protein kinase [Gemmataceae bacterium]|nr:protein kinase [Gemmataceae bacterium]
MSATCPTDDQLRQAVAGTLKPAQHEQIERHLEGCARCQQRCEAIADIHPPALGNHAGRQRSAPSWRLQQVIDRLSAGDRSAASHTLIDPPEAWAGERLKLARSDVPGSIGRLEQYEILRLIGRGGMGMVFEALDTVLNRTVAIKFLSPAPEIDDESRQRILREARAAAALHHEHIVAIHAVELDFPTPYLVLQYVEGESLAERLRRAGPLPWDALRQIAVETARGLAAAHAKGIVHRDIKPANILLERGTGRVKLADFGLAKIPNDVTLTQECLFAGTPEFASPEQASASSVDARSDVFSLGTVLYLAATGVSPFASNQPLLILDRVRNFHPLPLREVNPAIPAWFSELVDRMMAKDPHQRVQSASDLVRLLESPITSGRSRRWFTVARAAGLLGAVLLVMFGVMRYGWQRPRPEPAPRVVAKPPEMGFVISGRPAVYERLTDAVAEAENGDIIEVYGNGPFPTPPMQITGKRLTIRSGPGSRPVFTSEIPNQGSNAALITSDSEFHLEGVTIHWRTDAPPPAKPETRLIKCSAVVVTKGELRLHHCRIIAAGGCTCIAATVPELSIAHCHLVCDDGSAVYWRPSPGGHATIHHSALEGAAGVTVPTAADAPGNAPAVLSLTQNTFLVDKTLQLIIQVGPRQPLHVDARRNIFDHAQVVNLYATRFPKNFLPDTSEKTASMVRSIIRWSDESNLYRRGQALGLHSILAPREARNLELASLKEWLRIWDMDSPASVEGRIRFHPRGAKETETPRLDRVENLSGPMPKEVGAAPDQIGPRG